MAAGAVALAACPARSSPPGAPQGAPSKPARVVVESPSGRRAAVDVEVMRTPAELAKGLMFRERLEPDAGMLFVFPASEHHAFWMKNTLIPLDMIFVGEDLRVVGVVANAEPLTTIPRSVGKPSRYVLEVNGGWAAAHGVAAADRVRLEGDAAR